MTRVFRVLSCSSLTLLTVALGALLLVPSVGSAQADAERARQHFDAGTSYYEQARYTDAAREFQEAYRLSERPHLLKNVARSLEAADDFSGAAAALEEYLTREPEAEDRRTIEARVEQLQSRADESHEDSTEETEETQEHTTGGDTASDAGGGISVPGLILLSSGAALGVASLITGLMAHSDFEELTSSCAGTVCVGGQDIRDRGETLALVSTILTVSAVVVGGAGLGFLIFSGGSGAEDAQAHATPVFLGDGAGLSVDGQF